jgi:3-oxoacyl-[acyl-carrier-protein] synthase-3
VSDLNLGIVSVGIYLPPEVRRNDWWSPEVVQRWRDSSTKSVMRGKQREEIPQTPGIRLALEAMNEFRDDPFRGSIERRIKPDSMSPSDMEIAASKDAMERAGIDPAEVGLILVGSEGTDALLSPNAPRIHQAIGAPSECMAMNVESVCNAFSHQLGLAEGLIKSRRIKYALLVQSCSLPSLTDPDDYASPLFGDGATAVVVGPAGEGEGLVANHHFTDGSYYGAMYVGHPDALWYEKEKPRVCVANYPVARKLGLAMPDLAKSAIETLLEKSGLTSKDIGFMATHQPTPWVRRVVQGFVDAPQARSCDTFRWSASVGPSNVPLCIGMGEREGLLRNGDLLVSWTMGSGLTHSAFAIRWNNKKGHA